MTTTGLNSSTISMAWSADTLIRIDTSIYHHDFVALGRHSSFFHRLAGLGVRDISLDIQAVPKSSFDLFVDLLIERVHTFTLAQYQDLCKICVHLNHDDSSLYFQSLIDSDNLLVLIEGHRITVSMNLSATVLEDRLMRVMNSMLADESLVSRLLHIAPAVLARILWKSSRFRTLN
jgi:hypothetical protein